MIVALVAAVLVVNVLAVVGGVYLGLRLLNRSVTPPVPALQPSEKLAETVAMAMEAAAPASPVQRRRLKDDDDGRPKPGDMPIGLGGPLM